MRFFNDSLRLNLYLFSPYDILSKTGNLLLFQCTRNNSLDIYVLEGRRNKKVVAHSSGLQKLENSNLKILKFEARFAYAVKFWTDFFRLNFTQFFPDDSFSYDLFCLIQCTINKTGNLLLFHGTKKSLDIYLSHGQGNTKTRKPLICLQKLENSNLKILKFEARYAYAVKFWTDFFD
ncbi:conserved domain protein [Finegoldia magna SY403409CC001050417]|nr:conserved domain protein [Finegoldia magna SY403409CC001050417]